MYLFLTLNIFQTFISVSIADFEQVNVSWVHTSPERGLKAIKNLF